MGHKEVSAKISGFSKCSGETTTSLLPVADRTQVGRGVCRQESSGIDGLHDGWRCHGTPHLWHCLDRRYSSE